MYDNLITNIIIVYLVLLNIIGFVNMGRDKKRARMNAWRIKENTLFLTAIFGGSIGALLGMYYFHHKTKHIKFIIGMPLILVIQVALSYFIMQINR